MYASIVFEMLGENIYLYFFKIKNGDWGLGIGDWAQSPIPIKIKYSFQSNLLILTIFYK